MARQHSLVRRTAFGQLDELTRELTKMAQVVNARFVVDTGRLKELKSSNVRLISTKKRVSARK